MKQLLILGAGGMGKEIYYTAKHSIGYETEFVVKGFLDYPKPDWDTSIYPPILGIEDDYEIQPNDVFTCSIGDVHLKRKVCEKMKARGAKFQTLIMDNAEVRCGVKLGEGCIIDSYAHIGADVVIGDNCLIQGYAAIGHECKIGSYSRIDPRASIVGGVIVGENVTIHTSAVLNHKVRVGNNATIGAMSFVILKVKENSSVFGCPAKVLEF